MQAIVLPAPGGAEKMEVRELPRPRVGPGQVLVRVRACGVAHRDVIERRGGHPAMAFPIVQGHEFAGDVVEVGSGVDGLAPGDAVVNLYTDSCGVCAECRDGDERLCAAPTEAYGLSTNGGYADYVVVRERGLERLPGGIPWSQAAVLMSTVGVGYNNVVHNASVQAGERVLVTGATGGVGVAALQTAKLRGAETWAVTSSAAKEEALRQLGADHVVVDGEGRFHKRVRAEVPEGLDAVIDCVGGPTLNASIRSLRRFGRVAVIGTLDGPRVDFHLGYVVVQSIKVLGSENVSRSALREAMDLVAQGEISVRIDRELPLARAAEAHRLVEERAVVGRVVLVADHVE